MIIIESHGLSNMYWMPNMHENPVKARLLIALPKYFIKPLARAITFFNNLLFIFWKITFADKNKCRFFTSANIV